MAHPSDYLYARHSEEICESSIIMGGKTDLERVVAYVPAEWKEELEAWAEAEERSVSWLVSKLIDRALQERRPITQTVQQASEVASVP
ncbi:hypothetical protein NDI52_23820 [Leptolyngbya sp. PL-A3]|nr:MULTISPECIES: hypothetical protein [unclassified Leptolyngbya]